jgi:ABC-2 type transport system permease protein
MPTEVLAETLRERRRSLAWWTLGLVALVALNVAFYPSVRDSAGISDYGRDLPEAARALFAGGELDIASPAGYLNSQVFALMAPLLLLIFTIGAGASAVAGEEERGTLDLLLAHPLRRRAWVVQASWRSPRWSGR